jgi:hypothetical protein
MLRSLKASSNSEYCLLTNISYFPERLRRTTVILAICVVWFSPHAINCQTAAAPPPQSNGDCDGKSPTQRAANHRPGSYDSAAAAAEEAQSGSDSARNHLKLSTQATSQGAADPQGQFCSRERSDPGARRPLTTDSKPEEPTQSTQPTPPSPIAEITSGGVTIHANGQEFATVLEAVRAVAGITIEMPPSNEREPVFMNLGPVSTRDALIALLEGTKYNYVMVGSELDSRLVKKLILSERNSQAAPTTLVASAGTASGVPQPELYGGQGAQADAEAQNSEPQSPAAPPPPPPAAIPSSVPTGINIQQMAAQSNKTTGQILDELQKRQQQMLDDQAAAQPQ